MSLPTRHIRMGRNSLGRGFLIRNVCILWYCLLSLSSFTQDLKTFQYDTEDGLPSSEVYDIEIDSNGLIWFTTDRGVCTYDGYEFEVFTTKDGLADNTNFQIYKDSNDRLIFSGYSGVISQYKDGRFSTLLLNSSIKEFIAQNNYGTWFSEFFEDENGQIWAGLEKSQKGSIYIFGVDNKSVRGDFELRAIPVNCADTIYEILDFNEILGPFVVPSSSIKQKSNQRFELRHGVRIEKKIYLRSGRRIIVLNSELNFIGCIELDDKIIQLRKTSEGELFVCTTNGLFIYPNEVYRSRLHILPGRYVSSAIKDKEGNILVCTVNNGLHIIPSTTFKNSLLNKYFTRSKPMSMFSDQGELIIGDSRGGLILLSNETNGITTCKLPVEYQLRIISKYGENYFTNGYSIAVKADSILEFNEIGSSNLLVKLKNGKFLRESNFGFKVLDSLNLSQKLNIEKSQSILRLTYALEDSTRIWMGAMNGLFYVDNYDFNNIYEISHGDQASFGRINRLWLDENRNLWVASISKGLFCVCNNKVFHWDELDGLSSSIVNDVLIVKKRVFVATNKGLNHSLIKYNENGCPKLNDIHLESIYDGLSSNFINEIEYWNDSIWIATNKGINTFHEDDLKLTYPRIPVFIQSFSVGNEFRDLDSLNKLRYFENDLSIGYAAVSFRKPQNKPFYRYRLIRNGHPANWLETNDKKITFSDLSAGAYRFEVQARNKLDEWSEEPAVLPFEIKAHFTRTPWFLAIAALYIMGLIYAGIRWRIRSIKEKSENEQKLSAAQLKARDSELALLRNQMNPHFIFNALNSIQNFIFKQEAEKANYFLTRFSSLIRKSLELSKKSWISLEDEIEYLRQYLEMEDMRFPGKFGYQFNIQSNLDLGFLQIPTLLLQPIVENSVKHGFKNLGYKGRLVIDLRKVDTGVLQIIIEDNGIGISKDTLKRESRHSDPGQQPHGLQIIWDRLHLLQQEMPEYVFSLEITEAKNYYSGTKTILLLPLIFKEYAEIIGRR